MEEIDIKNSRRRRWFRAQLLAGVYSGGSGYSSESTAYFAALQAAGITATGGQKSAFETFVQAGKAAGWWTGIGRLILPVWNAAAPNAIDATHPGAALSWSGTVTHTGKSVISDGSTGYIDFQLTAAAAGMTINGLWMACMQIAGNGGLLSRTELPVGGYDPSGQLTLGAYGGILALTSGTASAQWINIANYEGLQLGYRTATNHGKILYTGTMLSGHTAPYVEASFTGPLSGLAALNLGAPTFCTNRPTVCIACGSTALTPASSEALAINLYNLITALRA